MATAVGGMNFQRIWYCWIDSILEKFCYMQFNLWRNKAAELHHLFCNCVVEKLFRKLVVAVIANLCCRLRKLSSSWYFSVKKFSVKSISQFCKIHAWLARISSFVYSQANLRCFSCQERPEHDSRLSGHGFGACATY